MSVCATNVSAWNDDNHLACISTRFGLEAVQGLCSMTGWLYMIFAVVTLAEMRALAARVLHRQITGLFRAAENALDALIAMVMSVREGDRAVEAH